MVIQTFSNGFMIASNKKNILYYFIHCIILFIEIILNVNKYKPATLSTIYIINTEN